MNFLDYLYALPNTTDGLDTILTETSTAFSGFLPLIFFFVFFVIFLGGISLQKSRTGTADYPMWSVVASLSIFVLALLTSVDSGLIRLEWLVIVTVITIFSAVWLFLDRKISEVGV